MPKTNLMVSAAAISMVCAGSASIEILHHGVARAQSVSAASPTPASEWVAAAPGRVEPRKGELRIGTPQPGRVIEVLVKVGDKVERDEMIVRLDDDVARADLAAAEAQEGALKRARDRAPAASGRNDVRDAEDAVFIAERAVFGARHELDEALLARRKGSGRNETVRAARQRLVDALDRLKRRQSRYAQAQHKPNLPAPSAADSQLSVGRSTVAKVEAILGRTRIRAPAAGTILQLNVKVGEFVAPSPLQPLAVIGDLSRLRVRAEVDARDVAKIKVGQRAFVRSTSYPGREFDGKVTKIAPTLAGPQIVNRGPRRPTDVEVLEVLIDLDGAPPLLTGMRVDAFFRR